MKFPENPLSRTLRVLADTDVGVVPIHSSREFVDLVHNTAVRVLGEHSANVVYMMEDLFHLGFTHTQYPSTQSHVGRDIAANVLVWHERVNPYAVQDQLANILTRGPANGGVGICLNVSPMTEIALTTLASIWPKKSGHPAYPIPHPSANPRRAYNHYPKWDGVGGYMRCNFLQFCVELLAQNPMAIVGRNRWGCWRRSTDWSLQLEVDYPTTPYSLPPLPWLGTDEITGAEVLRIQQRCVESGRSLSDVLDDSDLDEDVTDHLKSLIRAVFTADTIDEYTMNMCACYRTDPDAVPVYARETERWWLGRVGRNLQLSVDDVLMGFNSESKK